ncbi:GxxExxY protein [Geothrix sp. 21YS21S-4]|uniref:GxxExxY protein n=1 Tax=Geothrix sp. 21YS21S-4 TaxID=3068889 RepID=UPI0027B94166|nr:GxxExxY protein [Geothrix sp. 21YS21S-4]
MNTDQARAARVDHDPLTEAVIGCVFKVANALGSGFLEKVYENALAFELERAGLVHQQQVPISVHYEDRVVGTYIADLVVEGCLLLELKACRALEEIHTAQCLNYLKATRLSTCLLINFGLPKPQIKRLSRRPCFRCSSAFISVHRCSSFNLLDIGGFLEFPCPSS